eukprot:TRINITY_DN82938_c0_g1_i1.p1 TRINITY_DN82938_c0_g1~~TRINITY_DN82938_c0_g1_i1.p1  ORF type:complete len:435 (-),score=91.60 TRINITY_DN82938_c0_g1_i1:86-1369(-)
MVASAAAASLVAAETSRQQRPQGRRQRRMLVVASIAATARAGLGYTEAWCQQRGGELRLFGDSSVSAVARLRPPSALRGLRQATAKVALRALDAEFSSSAGASADPTDFDRALVAELEALKGTLSANAIPEDEADSDTLMLRRRIAEVRQEEQLRRTSELLEQEVDEGFQMIQVPLLLPLHEDSQNTAGTFGGEELRRLALQLYTKDGVDLLQQHVLGIIGQWEHLVRDYPLQLSLFQVGQVYWMSALFGYRLQSAERRYSLERAATLGTSDEVLPKSLGDYISAMGPQEALALSSNMSLEAQRALERRVSELCGDLAELWNRLLEAVGPLLGSGTAERALRQAIGDGEVESARVSVADLRRVALEGVAFGFLLGKAEAKADSAHSLTYTDGDSQLMILGAGSGVAWGVTGDASGRSMSGRRGFQES